MPSTQCVQPSTLKDEDEESRVKFFRRVGAPHIESFNFAITHGIQVLPKYIEPRHFRVHDDENVEGNVHLRVLEVAVKKPRIKFGSGASSEYKDLYPRDCLLSGSHYHGDLYIKLGIRVNGRIEKQELKKVGKLPIMVGSQKCNLHGLTPAELVEKGEEEYEFGGYFVANGGEKVLRMNLVQRVNHPVTAKRERNASRGLEFSQLSLSVRCQRPDLSTLTFHLHLMKSGAVRYRFQYMRTEYFVPIGVLIRALIPADSSYKEIFQLFTRGDESDPALRECILAIIVELRDRVSFFRKDDSEDGIRPAVSRTAAIAYLGRSFRPLLNIDSSIADDYEAGIVFMRRFICPHLSVNIEEKPNAALDEAKSDFLVYLSRKLIATSTGEIEVDDPDALSNLQVLLPGNLYLMALKDRLESCLRNLEDFIRMKVRKKVDQDIYDKDDLPEIVGLANSHLFSRDTLGIRITYLISTGNIRADDGLDLSSAAGFSVMAERINFLRFMSHFRAVHRGAFYASMRSTKVRKLLPEAWGFICPVHTPDGDPCGILNHLASSVQITQGLTANFRDLLELIKQVDVYISTSDINSERQIPVVIDGRVLCYVERSKAEVFSHTLRTWKVAENGVLPKDTEIVHVPRAREGRGQYEGIYLFTNGGRLVRPVNWHIKRQRRRQSKAAPNGVGATQAEEGSRLELIGTYEQVFLRIRLAKKEDKSTLTPVYAKSITHSEISATSFLSNIASLSPFPDMNQGPRNMFQCQMAKQAMGTPCHVFSKRFEAKNYRLTSPQAPITRNFCMQNPMGADLFGNGLNAIVAVISYTGNDMEDALILNQGSLDRGFAHGTVYETKKVDLDLEERYAGKKLHSVTHEKNPAGKTVESDGLPAVGARLRTGAHLYGISSEHVVSDTPKPLPFSAVEWVKHKSVETHTVDSVIVTDKASFKAGKTQDTGIRSATIRTRVSRRPIVGDKFASRAGQKGTVAAAWPMADMPYSESGMVPDIMFNPNGFPSRMTIGMMVESMAGKAGALHGQFQDSTPFRFDEKTRAVEHFATQLHQAGYNYYGNETLYSGYTGEPFEVEIFMGVVHYQRLRHMVSDKFQVRSTGKVHPLFRQPIKGRKRGGAIRFGEMERDGVLAHGASAILRDRLGTASDIHIVHVCEVCGSLITPIMAIATDVDRNITEGEVYCVLCGGEKSDKIRKVALPYSFKYLLNELAAMNISTELRLKKR